VTSKYILVVYYHSLHLATMVLTASPSKRQSKTSLSSHQIRKQKYKKISSVMATIAGAVTAAVHSSQHVDKQALHTSILTGQRWLDELLTGS
jgi:hypothetical protein